MKKTIFAGLAVLLPLVLTIWIFWYLIDLFTNPFLQITQDSLSPHIDQRWMAIVSRSFILLFLILFTFFLGVVARIFFIKFLLKIMGKVLSHIPFVSIVYRATKDIFGAFFKEEKDPKKAAFQYPCFSCFPHTKSFAQGFVTGQVPLECQQKVAEPLKPVFIPTAPHPISGYLLFVPEKQAKKLEMSNEEAVKFTVSCGLVTPEDQS